LVRILWFAHHTRLVHHGLAALAKSDDHFHTALLEQPPGRFSHFFVYIDISGYLGRFLTKRWFGPMALTLAVILLTTSTNLVDSADEIQEK
jgi:hypothetical protein